MGGKVFDNFYRLVDDRQSADTSGTYLSDFRLTGVDEQRAVLCRSGSDESADVMLAGKVDDAVQLFERNISRKFQQDRLAYMLLLVSQDSEYGTQYLGSDASPVDGIVIGIRAERIVQVGNLRYSQGFVGRMIAVDIDTQYIFSVSFPFQVSSTAAFPGLLKPVRDTKAWSCGRRKMRGEGFPATFSGVTVPTSRNPKPKSLNSSKQLASLSKPADSPTRLPNVRFCHWKGAALGR